MVMPPPIRPTFDHTLDLTVTQTVEALFAAIDPDGEYPITVCGKHVVLTVPPTAQHFWSPYLSMEAVETESGTELHGRFSPKPAVWTGFMLGYISLTTAGFFGLMFGVSLMMIERSSALAFVLAMVFLLSALGMYVLSQVGQRLAQAQMEELHGLVISVLKIESADGVGGGRSENEGDAVRSKSE